MKKENVETCFSECPGPDALGIRTCKYPDCNYTERSAPLPGMKTVTSVSGGRSSAYIAANYPADDLVFALVRIDEPSCRFPDESIRKMVEDRIQAPFIGTAEDDKIIYTMLDLEQYIGRKINWVTGLSFDDVVSKKGGWLPNKLHRYCTVEMKLTPMFYYWAKTYGIENPVKQYIGFRANEMNRANKMLERCNSDGFIEFKATFEKREDGKNKWITVPWQRPAFPLIEEGVLKRQIIEFWKDKPVRFADYNNCVGCFHRDPLFLRYMFQQHKAKMDWFASKEGGDKRHWKHPFTYAGIEKLMAQTTLYPEDFSSCDTGYCGI